MSQYFQNILIYAKLQLRNNDLNIRISFSSAIAINPNLHAYARPIRCVSAASFNKYRVSGLDVWRHTSQIKISRYYRNLLLFSMQCLRYFAFCALLRSANVCARCVPSSCPIHLLYIFVFISVFHFLSISHVQVICVPQLLNVVYFIFQFT